MTAQIYLLGDDAKLLSMSEAPYDSESLLQELLANYPNLLAGEQMDLWLCPALGHYFRPTPQRIYVRVEPLPEGVDPIWHDGGRGKRYVGD